MESNAKRGIYEFHFEVTGNCNLRCVYCYNSEYRKNKHLKEELTLSEIKKLVKETKKYGTKLYTLTGGEPFTRKDFFGIINEMKGRSVAILTNGKVINEELIKCFKKYPQIKEFKISWDGFSSHNKLRKGSDWRQIREAIRKLKDNNYKVVVNTVVLKDNQKDLYKLYLMLKKLKVNRWRVDVPFLSGRYIQNNNKFFPPDPEYFTIIFKKIIIDNNRCKNKIILEIFNLYKSQFVPTNTVCFNNDVHPCEYKRELLSMKPNGDIIFCPSLSFPMANFRKEGTLDRSLLKESKHPFYNLKIKDLIHCRGCRYLKLCGGGCRANAIYEFNDYYERDLTACTTFPEWEKIILPILKKSHKKYFEKLINKDGKSPQEIALDIK